MPQIKKENMKDVNMQRVWTWKHLDLDQLCPKIFLDIVCLVIYGAHMNILYIVKVKILNVIKWSYRSPQDIDYQVLSSYHTLST